ncbi:NAD(P)H-dependent oxidoreductase [Luteolibacter ambystomatis]|uniref:NAD(P)H-dependent oxidoreductase n=1 Tax=Luteolibacter ambystomatis TaxID=2824561 RepID=A0A975IYU2_9BACT|nr:NAD(P)H-dependent oxidoreductase [Luteolibacter ambystomatis]QUE50761.1 NAD(P)H-dependent oxidoreductase [Luteolibacter ambystomatis]
MSVPTPDSIVTALRWRYATKVFDPARRIPAETWAALEQSLVLTPSSFGLQPWQFLVVENPAVRAELRAKSWGQGQVTDASHFVVFAARTDLSVEDISGWVARLAGVQGTTPETLAPMQGMIEGFVSSMPQEARHTWNVRQVYIALGQFMTTAALLGIDTCPMEGLDPNAYDQILGLEDSGYATAVACAVGYRSEDDHTARRPKARYEADNVIRRIV